MSLGNYRHAAAWESREQKNARERNPMHKILPHVGGGVKLSNQKKGGRVNLAKRIKQRVILTNTEQFKLLSQPFIRQKELELLFACSQSKVSDLLKKHKVLKAFGLGYATQEIIKKFRIDFDRIIDGMKAEEELHCGNKRNIVQLGIA